MHAEALRHLRSIGARQAIQVATPRELLLDNGISFRMDSVPGTGPGGSPTFRNRGNSQIPAPEITNIYMGQFWGNRAFIDSFAHAILERGFLQPLADLGYGTGPGRFVAAIDGESLVAGTVLSDSDAQTKLGAMIDAGTVTPNANSLYVMLLPPGVTSTLGNYRSCATFCGYHEAFMHNGVEIAYAVLPSPVGCNGCGNGDVGDFTAVYAHEVAEACTDRIPGSGWIDDNGQENGDLEAWILFNWGPPTQPDRYKVQGYYTNERGNTFGAWAGAP